MALNIMALLGDIGVPFWTSGKNISDGWISVSCPMCGEESNHGAFAPDGFGYSCFICGKHSVKKVLAEYTSWQEATTLIKEYSSALYSPDTHIKERASVVEWPPPNAVPMPSAHAKYLFDRGFDPKQMREQYGMECCWYSGPMKYRIVIPVYQNGRLVSYVGRDITGKSSLKYKNLSETKSVLPVKETIFNLDSIHETAIICEGPFDAIRFGAHGVCVWGLQYTSIQTKLLASRLKRAVIAFDSERIARERAMELGADLDWQGVQVDILSIDAADPGELSKEEAESIKQKLGI